MIVGRRWRELKENLAEEMLKTNELARAIINGERPTVYALNHAFATYQIEMSGGINTSYTLYNREAVERLFRENPTMLPPPGKKVAKAIAEGKAIRWSKEKLQSVATQSILQGDSIPEMARRLATEVSDYDYKAQVRNARTIMTNVQNAGRYDAFRRADRLGIELVIEWAAVLDGRTRHAHREMHGQRTSVDEPFHTPDGFTILWPADTNEMTSTAPQEEIWNCRCTLLAWVAGFEHDMLTTSDYLEENDLTFEEWLEEKPESRPIMSQWQTGEAIKMQYVNKYKKG